MRIPNRTNSHNSGFVIRRSVLALAICLMGTAPLSADEPVVLGVLPDLSPAMFLDESGKPAGFLVELFTSVMEDLDCEYRIIVAPINTLYPMILDDQVDIFAGMLKTPARQQELYYSEKPVLSGWSQVFVAEGTTYDDIWSLNNRNVGVVEDDQNGANFVAFADDLGLSYNLRTYRSFDTLFQAVRNQDVFAGVVYSTILFGKEGLVPSPTVFSPLPGYAVTSKNSEHKDTLDRIIRRIEELKADDNSYYHELVDKWLVPSRPISRRLRQLLLSSGIVMLLTILILMMFNYALRAMVRKRTSEIELSDLILQNAIEGVMITDSESRVIKVNPSVARITGFQPQDLIGKTPDTLSSGVHNTNNYEKMKREIDATGTWKGEFTNRKKNGEKFVQSTSVVCIRNREGKIVNYASIFNDESRRIQYEKDLHILAYKDALTGLPNRLALDKEINRRMGLVESTGRIFALIMIEIDSLKDFNGVYGKKYGDLLINEIAVRLRSNLMEHAYLSRYIFDEFCILVRLDSSEELEQEILPMLQRLFERRFSIDSSISLYVNAKIGGAVYPQDAQGSIDIFQAADYALVHAKTNGLRKSVRYQQEIVERVRRRLRIEQLLSDSVRNEEFSVVYQPKLDAWNRTIIGVEALVRWTPEANEMINPDEFIPVAEETGKIIQIGEFVLNRACKDIGEINRKLNLNLTVAVNVSAVQLLQDNFTDTVTRVLAETNLQQNSLEIEITESTAMSDKNKVRATLSELKKRGCTIAMDDFGTGYSSLAHLKDFPLNTLKIDRAFVSGIPEQKADSDITRTIISIAKSLDLDLVAEGVETVDQMAFLQNIGCNVIQGYLLSAPIMIRELETLIQSFDFDIWRYREIGIGGGASVAV